MALRPAQSRSFSMFQHPGQLLDTMCDNLTLADFSLDRWQAIVTYKTAFYSFYLSVAFAMTYAGIEDQAAYDAARTILVKMGVYFQAQDDYLDCYGTPEQIGKIGTDIESKKCGWCAAAVPPHAPPPPTRSRVAPHAAQHAALYARARPRARA